jgi:hypothetical protein
MSSDDDKLEDFDLSAWEAPPPPAELADAVIDRMGGTDVGMAVPPVDEPREPKRTWLIAGVAAAVVALGIGVWTVVRSTHHAAPSSGGVVAERAQTLSLDTVHADLDPGADVRWVRRGGVLHVEQRAGNAVWHVDANEKLVIDAGASLASVEAEGANLRVEVQMNAMDARVIGASALTAAAVAVVSVVVYEGHVSVSRSGQQTVVVAPGSAYQVKRDPEPPVVGSAPIDIAAGQRVAVLGLDLVVVSGGKVDPDATVVAHVLGSELRAIPRAGAGPYVLGPGTDKELVDEKLLMNCENEAPDCMAAIGQNLGVDALMYGKVEPNADGYAIAVKLLDVGHKTVIRAGTWTMPTAEAQGEDLTSWAKKIYFDLTGMPSTTCDAEALKEKGMENINMGQHAAALALFEASLRCKKDPYVTQLAFMEACSSSNSPKAKQYYKQMSPAQQTKFSQICIRQKVAYEDDDDDSADTRCDEVSCVLNNYEGACCDKFRGKYQPASTIPEMIGRAEISREINRIKPDIYACGDKVQAGGKVKVNVHVAPKGSVTDVTVTEAPTPELGSCIAAVIEKAHFAATQKGGSFSYPFVIPAPAKTAAAPPANCDAEALKEKGMENINMGQHAAALAQLEASLKCKNDAYVRQLAYMEACNSQNATKARTYFAMLSPDAQAKFEQLCIRNRINPRNGTAVSDTDTTATMGYLQVATQPTGGKVLVDNVDTGFTTPVMGHMLKLTPGKHKITLVIGGDRFTYPVVIKAGVTETMSKDLR